MKKIRDCVSTLAVCGLLFVGHWPASAQQVEPKAKPTPPPAATLLEDKKITLRQRTELVSLMVTVTDRQGRAMTELSPHEIEIYEDKVKQTIEYFSAADSPLSAGVVFDHSGSMAGSMARKMDSARRSLRRFVDAGHAEDEFFVVGFNRQANLLAEFSDGESAGRRLNFVSAQGETALYDAVYLGIEKILQGRHQRRALLLISDGQDNASRYSLEQVRRRLKETDVQLYAVGVIRPGLSDKAELREQQRGQMILEELAQLTGGRAFFVSSEVELEEATTRIALELRRQYSLAYTPTNQQRNGQWRKIKIRINRSPEQPPLIVRAREGYFAAPR